MIDLLMISHKCNIDGFYLCSYNSSFILANIALFKGIRTIFGYQGSPTFAFIYILIFTIYVK